MAVTCPTCGRSYDVSLFQFGRTLSCTCGARVGMEPRIGPVPPEPRFFLDAMLGRLARWLRLLGYDARWEPRVEDADLVRQALQEGRILVTRDRRLLREWRVPRAIGLEAEKPEEQLRELASRLGLRPRRLFERCGLCNVALERATAAEARDRLPPHVRATHDGFFRCPACGRLYWRGSHTRRFQERVARLLGLP